MFQYILILVILLMLTALISFSESALKGSSPAKLEKLADEGNKKSRRLCRLNKKPERPVGALVICFIASGLTAGCIIRAVPHISDSILRIAAAVGIILVSALVFMVLGILIPSGAALKEPEKAALRMSRCICIFRGIFKPFSFLTGVVSSAVLKLMGIDPDSLGDAVSEEEIIMMSDAGAENGTIDETESRMIKNVFAFDDLTAEQICTHRTDVSVLWSEDDVKTWEETIHRTRHSRYPICGESVDNVIGILNSKDYFRLRDKSRENIMKNAVKEPYFVHETMKADMLFAQMKRKNTNKFAVVVDEYGGMSGVITVTDLVEELVGDFDDDESGKPDEIMKKLSDDTWIIPGITPIDEVCEELGIDLSSDRYDTFGGYVIAELGEIPKDGTKTAVETDDMHIEILHIAHHRIRFTKVKLKNGSVSSES